MAITIRDSHFSSRSPFSRSTTAIDQKESRLILRRTRSSRFSSRNIIIISLQFFFFSFFFIPRDGDERMRNLFLKSLDSDHHRSLVSHFRPLATYTYIYVCMYIRNSVQLAWHNEKAGLEWCNTTGETVVLWQKLTLTLVVRNFTCNNSFKTCRGYPRKFERSTREKLETKREEILINPWW